MDSLAAAHPRLQGRFRVDWKQGEIHSEGELLVSWRVSVEDAKIRLHTQAKYTTLSQDAMPAGLRRLHFGHDGEEGSEAHKGKGKSQGKGKKKSQRFDLPLEPTAFHREPAVFRNALGSLQLARYPFTVTVKKMREEQGREDEERSKRTSDGADSEAKRRAPTPDRQTYSAAGQIQDPWMQASSLPRAPHQSASPSRQASASSAAAPSHPQAAQPASQCSEWPSGTISA